MRGSLFYTCLVSVELKYQPMQTKLLCLFHISHLFEKQISQYPIQSKITL